MHHNLDVTYCRTLLLLVCVPVCGQQYAISTVAGNGVAGAFLINPASVAVDPAGDVYVADWSSFIRKIWVRDRVTTTVAGIGVLGHSGDGGQATNAMIGKAINVAVDASGNIYFADGDNHRIRRVDTATGIITTAAGAGADSGDGGPAANAGVSRTKGITVAAMGDLYFSSSWSRVRRLIATTGTIETIAGQSINGVSGDDGPAVDALFWGPVPSAVNRGGDVYIADFENSRVRVVMSKTDIVSVVAGSGACRPGPTPFLVPAAVALDAGGNLYIADKINHRIRLVDASTGHIFTIAGNGLRGFSGDGGLALAAELSFPSGIAVDPSGRVYFSDQGNNRIRVLTPVMTQANRPRPRPQR